MARSNIPSLEDLEGSIRKHRFSPIYFFYGEEEFLLQELVDSIVANALNPTEKSFNFDVVNGYDADAKDVVSIASAFPMMAERRVVIVKDFERIGNKDIMIPYFTNPLPSTVLVLMSEKKLDSRTKLAKALEQFAVVVEFGSLKDYKVPSWIATHVARRKKEITGEACELLHAHVGNSLREIHNEIEKLLIYIGERKTIGLDDIDYVVGISKRYNIFELQNAIGAGDISRAQEIMERMLDVGESPIGLVSMLTRYYQKMWVIIDLIERKISREELIKFLHLSPGQVQFLDREIQIAKTFPSGHVEHCFLTLQETDEKLKSSSLDARLLLTILLNRIVLHIANAVNPVLV